MNPGKLDQRITFQYKSRTPDEGGGASIAWVNIPGVHTVWASVRALKGRERIGAGERVEAEAGYLFTIRNRSDISEKNIILWNGRKFNIRFVRDLSDRPLYMEIEADQGVAI